MSERKGGGGGGGGEEVRSEQDGEEGGANMRKSIVSKLEDAISVREEENKRKKRSPTATAELLMQHVQYCESLLSTPLLEGTWRGFVSTILRAPFLKSEGCRDVVIALKSICKARKRRRKCSDHHSREEGEKEKEKEKESTRRVEVPDPVSMFRTLGHKSLRVERKKRRKAEAKRKEKREDRQNSDRICSDMKRACFQFVCAFETLRDGDIVSEREEMATAQQTIDQILSCRSDALQLIEKSDKEEEKERKQRWEDHLKEGEHLDTDVKEFYFESLRNPSSFVSIRRGWDEHIVDENEGGTSIPLAFIPPPFPSSPQWAAYLVTRQ